MAVDSLLFGRIQSFLITQRGINDAISLIDFEISEIDDVSVITRWASRLGVKPTTAQLLAVSDVEATSQITKSTQRSAQSIIDSYPIEIKALILALIDQINVLRSKLSPPLVDITPAQAITAIRNKAGTL